MSRTVFIIRHAQATGGRYDKHLFPSEGAPLSASGIKDAERLGTELRDKGIDFNQKVAISAMVRTKQTAESAGFKKLKEYDTLNEICLGLNSDKLDELIENKKAPQEAIVAAKKLLQNPPSENIWVTHGVLIVGIAHVLNVSTTDLYIPDMASVSEVIID